MVVEAQVTINAPRADVWAAITDIEHAADFISGIEGIEVLDKPARGLVGLRWRETRMLFGKPWTAEKWITHAVEHESFSTRAEEQGFAYLSTMRMAQGSDGITLTSVHVSEPHGIVAKVLAIHMGVLFKGVAKKALLQDLHDIKAAVERGASAARPSS
jgi:uncharacterized membrane protein